jgi:hypothetical protein
MIMESIINYFLENWPAFTLLTVFFIGVIILIVRLMSFLSKMREESAKMREETGMSLAKMREETGISFAKMREEFGMSFVKMREESGISFAKIETEIKHINQRLDKLPCEERRKENQTSINQLKDGHHKIEIEISMIKSTIDTLKNLLNPAANANSPLTLTDEGKEYAKDLDVENVIDKNWKKIYDDLEENIAGQSRYDIQQYLIDIFPVKINLYLEQKDIDNLKEYAFIKGKNMYWYFLIYSLVIRDRYFKQKGLL